MLMNMYVHGYVYVYDSICWALKCPVHCAEPFLELKICISPQFRAIDPPNPARGFIQQNENVRFATAACMQKYGNVSFATVACAKCMRYGGRGGGRGGVATRDTEPYIPESSSQVWHMWAHQKQTWQTWNLTPNSEGVYRYFVSFLWCATSGKSNDGLTSGFAERLRHRWWFGIRSTLARIKFLLVRFGHAHDMQ